MESLSPPPVKEIIVVWKQCVFSRVLIGWFRRNPKS